MNETYPSAVYHLVFYKNQLTAELKSLHTFISHFENEHTRPLYLLVFSDALLTATKFMDEYNRFFRSSSPEVNKEINITKKILKPAIKEVTKWVDLNAFRNNVLAHNFRIEKKNNDSVFEHGGFSAFNIPETVTDLMILIECISMAGQIIEKKFKLEYEQFAAQIKRVEKNGKSSLTQTEAENYIQHILKEMKEIAQQQDREQETPSEPNEPDSHK